jgi:hypothetical protein
VYVSFRGAEKAFKVRGSYAVWKVLNAACMNFKLPKPCAPLRA